MEFVNEAEERKKKKKDTAHISYLLETIDPNAIIPGKTPEKKTQTNANKETAEDDENQNYENLSEASVNDYGLFDYKIPIAIKKEPLSKSQENDNKKTKNQPNKDNLENNKYNLVKHIGEAYIDPVTLESKRIATKKIDVMGHIMKEQNDYVGFLIVDVKKIKAEISKIKNQVFYS